METFIQLGRVMAKDLALSAKDLETRINSLGPRFPQEQVRAVVTGYIDASLESNFWNITEVYALLHGFGRWLYNGTFEDVRNRVLDKIAQRNSPSRAIVECLEGDQEGINHIAEARIDRDPEFALGHYKGERRPEVLRRIIEKHGQSKDRELRDAVIGCLRELNDTEGIRALAYQCLETNFDLAEHMLVKYGTREDKLKLVETVKKAGDIEKAGKLITEHGTDKDIAAFIEEIRNTHIRTAYELARRSGLTKLYIEIRQQMIQEHPEVAQATFYAKQYADGHPQLNDREGMLEVAKRFGELRKRESAIRAYAIAYSLELASKQQEQIRIEVRQHALEILRAGQEVPALKFVTSGDIRYAVEEATITYFTEGGNPITADELLGEVNPDLSMKLAQALAKLPGENATGRAYARLIRTPIGKLSKKAKELLAELRERILETPYAANFFVTRNDNEGMRAYIERNIESNPKMAYEIATKGLRDETATTRTRQALIQKTIEGKIKVTDAFGTFEEAKDQLGITELQQALAPGVERKIAETLLARQERRYR